MTHPASPKLKPDTSPASTRLTPSEIESLRQNKRDAVAAAHRELDRLEAAKKAGKSA
jgi:hypothetical protein